MDVKLLRYADAAARTPLFEGIDPRRMPSLLESIGARISRKSAGELLISQGEDAREIFLLLEGTAVGSRTSENGRTVRINEFCSGNVFGDLLSGSRQQSPVSVAATSDCVVLRFPFESLTRPAQGFSDEYARLIRSLFAEIAHKYFALNRRFGLLLNPTLRGKIAGYALENAARESSDAFTSPHSREQLAEYLNCERSALSRELSRMRAQGLIDFERRSIRILNRAELERLAQ